LQEANEEAASHNEIVWGMEFEEEQLAGLKGFETRLCGRSPEVHFLYPTFGREESEPTVIGYANEEPHWYSS
jgi:hypothetical protein